MTSLPLPLTMEDCRRALASTDGIEPVLLARPFELASALDMLRVYAGLSYGILTQIEQIKARFKKKCDSGQGGELLTPREKSLFNVATGIALMECANLELTEPLKRKRKIRRYIDPPAPRKRALRLTYEKAHTEIEELKDAILAELNDRVFLRIPTSLEHYYFAEDREGSPFSNLVEVSSKPLFDDETKPLEKRFSKRWPNANNEIIAAGNCYATGNNTAAVFHLMRAVEHGARALVAGLGLTLNLKRPIELCSWDELIRVLDPAVTELKVGHKTSRQRNDKWAFYDKAVGHFKHFRVWRDPVAHARKIAQEGETKDAFHNVRQFMVHLNDQLKEQPVESLTFEIQQSDNPLPEN